MPLLVKASHLQEPRTRMERAGRGFRRHEALAGGGCPTAWGPAPAPIGAPRFTVFLTPPPPPKKVCRLLLLDSKNHEGDFIFSVPDAQAG